MAKVKLYLDEDITNRLVVVLRSRGVADTVVRLALDTGETGCVLNWDVVVLLGYDPAIISERVQMTTGSGVEFVPRLQV